MASKETGFHPQDSDWTQGRAKAIADSDAVARRQIGMSRKITLSALQETAP